MTEVRQFQLHQRNTASTAFAHQKHIGHIYRGKVTGIYLGILRLTFHVGLSVDQEMVELLVAAATGEIVPAHSEAQVVPTD